MEIAEKIVEIKDKKILPEIFRQIDKNKKAISSFLGTDILMREDQLKIVGEEEKIKIAERIILDIINEISKNAVVTDQKFNYILKYNIEGNKEALDRYINNIIITTHSGRLIKTKTIGQKIYTDSIRNKDVVFGIGPAGTGKTFLAVAMAVNAFKNNEVERIILTRPAVEAGEKLGFLPGDLQDKVDPYLRPLYDALFDIMGPERYIRNVEKGLIEVAPLAYMRGRTLDSSFIILDEAQNTTVEQMKMFLTRLGYGSKAVITGDVTQIDLPAGKKSGLKQVEKILERVEGIDFVYFDDKDVVRHKLVQDIIKAYEKYESKK